MTEYINASFRVDNASNTFASFGTVLAAIVLLIFFAQRVSEYVDLSILSLLEYLWHGLVSLVPSWLIPYRLRNDRNGNTSSEYAAKSQSLRSLLRLDRIGPAVASPNLETNSPKGLGNWDNSCYQNSILQALASIPSVSLFLSSYDWVSGKTTVDTTTQDLADLLSRLNDPFPSARYLWTPPRLKSMDSWQQQDAQEYYARISDEIEKDFIKALGRNTPSAGFESIRDAFGSDRSFDERDVRVNISNPLEGLFAQRIGCTACGFVEGLSLIPFTSITLPLPNLFSCDVADCLDDFTALESIQEVECLKCTLIQARQQLLDAGDPGPAIIGNGSAQDEVNDFAEPPIFSNRLLQRIEDTIADEDFTEATVAACKIPKSSHASSTKTRQAVIMRPPKCLALHFNRSMFDELTGDLKKNYAATTYPKTLSLGRWSVSRGQIPVVDDVNEVEAWTSSPTQSILSTPCANMSRAPGPFYSLCAVVTHFGRHENGHYVCFRKLPPREEKAPAGEIETSRLEHSGRCPDPKAPNWWRISDEKVLAVSEHDALAQEGAFMLFYERIDDVPDAVASSSSSSGEDRMSPESADCETELCDKAPVDATIQNVDEDDWTASRPGD